MLSRRSRLQDKKQTRRGILFLALALLLIVVFFVVGIPTVVKIAGFAGSFSSNKDTANVSDKTPPGPPQFDPTPPDSSETGQLTISGRAEAGSTLKILRNGEKIKEVKIDDTSKFTTDIELIRGKNNIALTATDASGNESISSSTYDVYFDTEPPVLEITKPQDKDSFYGLEKTIQVEGKTNPDSQLTVNGHLAILGSDGSFSEKITLAEGDNTITVVAKGQSGLKTEKSLVVTYAK